MLPDILNYVPDPNNGRPLAGAKVYFMIGGYTAPVNEYDFDVTKIAPITANGDVVPQPLYTSQGGTLRVGSQVDQPTLIPSGLTQKVAVYDKCGKLVYQVGYSAQGAFVSSAALAAVDSQVLIAGIPASDLASGGGGGGIVYTDSLPETKSSGTTYFIQNNDEAVFTYNDGDSTQYLAYPLIPSDVIVDAGSGGGGASTTLTNTSSAGLALVGTPVANNYPIKRLLAGTGVTLAETSTDVIINSSGGAGSGIVYSETLPATKVAGTTYFRPDSYEQVYTYNDGDSVQYLADPIFSTEDRIVDISFSGGGGGGTTTLSNEAGVGIGLVNPIIGNNYPIKKIAAGAGISVTDNAANVTIANTGAAVVQNVGSGANFVRDTVAGTVSMRSITSSNASLTVTQSADTINIATATIPFGGVNNLPTARLLGRTTSGTGVAEAISIGANLSLSGGVLSATGGGSLGAALTAIDALTPANNRIPYFTGSTTAALTDFTALARAVCSQTQTSGFLAQLGITLTTNANGTSLRIPTSTPTSGIQICFRNGLLVSSPTTANGNVWISADSGWTFPQAFASTPVVTGTAIANPYVAVIGGSTGSASSWQVRTMSGINNPGDSFVNLMAIGVY